MATTTNNGWTTPNDTDLVKDGALAIRTLGNGIDTSVGTGLLAWQTYTVTVGGTGWVKGTGVTVGRYCQIGKTVHFEINYTFQTGGGGTAGTGAVSFNLPVNANTTVTPNHTQANLYDASASTAYLGQGSIGSTSVQVFVVNTAATYGSLANVQAGQPFVWAANDEVRVNGTYECV